METGTPGKAERSARGHSEHRHTADPRRTAASGTAEERDAALYEVAGLQAGPAADDSPAEHPALAIAGPEKSAFASRQVRLACVSARVIRQ